MTKEKISHTKDPDEVKKIALNLFDENQILSSISKTYYNNEIIEKSTINLYSRENLTNQLLEIFAD